jgi:hypothetical protein
MGGVEAIASCGSPARWLRSEDGHRLSERTSRRPSRVRACILTASTGAVVVIVLSLGAFSSIGTIASTMTSTLRHAAFDDADTTPRVSAVMQDAANAPELLLRVKDRRSVVAPGGTAVFLVHLRSLYVYKPAATLRAFGLPVDARAEFKPGVVVGPDGTATLTIQTRRQTPLGSIVFRVLASGDGLSTTCLATLTIH